jgi:DnaK suppressor protein
MSKIHTEAQLLKLPASAYMNADQLAFFALRLNEMKQALLDNALDTGEHLRENETLADPNDRASMEEGNQLEQRVRDRERKLLKKIDAALSRIDDGSFGFCQDSGEPIGLPRLLARPTAELSVESQERHERREKLHG